MSKEAALLINARRLDEDALAAIYDKYSTGLYRYAYRNLGDVSQAEDCVAETFTRLLSALSKGGGPRKHLQAYLYRTAHNWIMDYYRREPPPEKEYKDKPDIFEITSLYESADNAAQKDKVRAAMEKLTKNQQQVIALKFLEGWNNKEIAQALSKPIGSVNALQSRALASLRRILLYEKNQI